MNVLNLNTYIITTKNVINNNFPIIRVIHDEDGDWQFLGDEENLTEDDAVVISIEELLSIDKSVKEVLNMPIEKQAMRINKESSWYYFEL
jgi:hypothetical protein